MLIHLLVKIQVTLYDKFYITFPIIPISLCSFSERNNYQKKNVHNYHPINN